MNKFIALYKNHNYKLFDSENDLLKKKDKIAYVMIPTDTLLKGPTYTLIEGEDLCKIHEEEIHIGCQVNFSDVRKEPAKFRYNFKIDSMLSAYNIYPFFKLFSHISIFTTIHTSCQPLYAYAAIDEYPGSTRYPYKLDRDKFKLSYHDYIMKFIFTTDGRWYLHDKYNNDGYPDNMCALYIYNIEMHDGYLFTSEIYHNIKENGKLYLELSTAPSNDYPTEGESLLNIYLEDKLHIGNHEMFEVELIEALLIVPQIIMLYMEILKEDLYLLMVWNDRNINQLLHPGEQHNAYSLYSLIINN